MVFTLKPLYLLCFVVKKPFGQIAVSPNDVLRNKFIGDLYMKKCELIRYKAGLAALLVSGSMLLSGCAKGFELTVDEERNIVAEEDSYK